MLFDEKAREVFAKLELEFSPVALKYTYAQPAGVAR